MSTSPEPSKSSSNPERRPAARLATPEEQAACDFGFAQGAAFGAYCKNLEWAAVCDWPLFHMNEFTYTYIHALRVLRKHIPGPIIMINEPDHAP